MKLQATFKLAGRPVQDESSRVSFTCNCGRTHGYSSPNGWTNPGWTVTNPLINALVNPDWDLDQPVTMESPDHSCREILFGYLVGGSMYAKEVSDLRIRGLTSSNSSEVRAVIEALTNAIWLGMTEFSSKVAFIPETSVAQLPIEMFDRTVDNGGPLFSIIAWFLKAGAVGLGATSSVSQYVRPEAFMDSVMPLLSAETLTRLQRKELVRHAVRFLWENLNGKNGQEDNYSWAKYLCVWSSLGGLKAIGPKQGLGYLTITREAYNQITDPFVCWHNVSSGRYSTHWNGSRTFYNTFFNRVIDGRSVQRFLSGGRGMTRATAKTYMNQGYPWSNES